MQKVHKLMALEKIQTELLKEKVQQRRQTILSKFEKMREFQAEEEAQQLHNLALEEEKVLRKLEEMKSQVSQQGTILKELIGRLEEKCEKLALELLQDVETLLSRCEAAELQVSWDVSVELRSVCHVFGMREMLCKFQAPMRLDEDAANPSLMSESLESAKKQHTGKDLRPKHGFWTIAMKNDNFYAGKICFPVRGSPKMVGVYVNYEVRTVSFYNLTNRIHIYSYQGSNFSGSLCPIFLSVSR
ncbi:E3 ubiquitin-protein ligase TRIM58-like [Ornithorhynchus anatinus]|uniref:E3 ubiquitin-protein ligase TRIM58-like n=1 Tax=Ornithorhynchus anatinus TaxID=9258 RepID=UPI0019D48456|nr:E3 ubiquitin-protein ligase TRIM58-like [Ornithorhynchus anatinus]